MQEQNLTRMIVTRSDGTLLGALRAEDIQTRDSELHVWERSSEMVLAAHHTEVKCGTTTTVETVHFERPERIVFRVVRGPVPHVVESFVLAETDRGTLLTREGELGTDFWGVGRWWGSRVARQWEQAVRRSLLVITAEAERRAA